MNKIFIFEYIVLSIQHFSNERKLWRLIFWTWKFNFNLWIIITNICFLKKGEECFLYNKFFRVCLIKFKKQKLIIKIISIKKSNHTKTLYINLKFFQNIWKIIMHSHWDTCWMVVKINVVSFVLYLLPFLYLKTLCCVVIQYKRKI